MGAKTVCSNPAGCANLTHAGLCDSCRSERRTRSDRRRGSSRQRGYTARWERKRSRYLRDHPSCECEDCLALPLLQRELSTEVHHLDGLGPTGPRGYDDDNLAALAHDCHSRITAREQPGGWAVSA